MMACVMNVEGASNMTVKVLDRRGWIATLVSTISACIPDGFWSCNFSDVVFVILFMAKSIFTV